MACPCCCGPCTRSSAKQMIVDFQLSPFAGGCDSFSGAQPVFDNCGKLNGSYVLDISSDGGCGVSSNQYTFLPSRSFSYDNWPVWPDTVEGYSSHLVRLNVTFSPGAGLAQVSITAGYEPSLTYGTQIGAQTTYRTFQKSYHPTGVPKNRLETNLDSIENKLIGDVGPGVYLTTAAKKCILSRVENFNGTEKPSGCYSDPLNWIFTSDVTYMTNSRYSFMSNSGDLVDTAMRYQQYNCDSSMCPKPSAGGSYTAANDIYGRRNWIWHWNDLDAGGNLTCSALPACVSRCDVKNATINIRFQ